MVAGTRGGVGDPSSSGNAQEVYSWSPVHEDLESLGSRMLLVDYHGYGKSGREPHEAGLYLDGRAALDWLAQRGVADDEIIVFGKSWAGRWPARLPRAGVPRPGAGIHFHLARERVPQALSRAARGLELEERYASIGKIGKASCPVLIIHGDRDELIPTREGLRLFGVAPPPKKAPLVAGAGL